MKQKISICWFRKDLRIHDNPALFFSLQEEITLPIFIFYNTYSSLSKDIIGFGWLYSCLRSLNKDLNNSLQYFEDSVLDTFSKLCSQYTVGSVYCNRCYEPEELLTEQKVSAYLLSKKISFKVFHSNVLIEPTTILKKDGSPYKLFTPFYKKALSVIHKPFLFSINPKELSKVMPNGNMFPPKRMEVFFQNSAYSSLKKHPKPTEKDALKVLSTFLNNKIENYYSKRDFPAEGTTSRLSPYLHLGLLSPHRIFHYLNKYPYNNNVETFLRELLWRDFSFYLLYHNPSYPNTTLNKKLYNYPWKSKDISFQLWANGLTGYPFVDAGMRELLHTGYMHNRCRMVVASFLTKNLHIDWRKGADWFLTHLLDADIASNSINWQWVAGTGIDANPFFRIFNPILQGEKFDPTGQYTKQYIPELQHLPSKFLFKPWEVPKEQLREANITLGEIYPFPIVNYSISRKEALSNYRFIL